jgi:hypothetical protein
MSEFLKLLATTKGGKAILATPSVIMLFAFWWIAAQITDIRERLVRMETRLEFYEFRQGAATIPVPQAGKI